jgi:hypothetical protein
MSAKFLLTSSLAYCSPVVLYGCDSWSLTLVSYSGWGETEHTWYVGHCFPIVPAPDDR